MKLKNIYWLLAFNFFITACGTSACDSSEKDSTDPGINDEDTDVSVLVTTNNRSLDLAVYGTAFSTTSNMSPYTITLQPKTSYQQMDGFGAALTGSSCYNLMQMSAADRTSFLTQTFSNDKGYGFSYVRISIGCSDFSLSEYTCCDEPGIENFALQNEEINYIIPVLKEVLEINPDLKILGSPWTSPRWMKVNNLNDLQALNSWTSGQLNPAYYSDYALYFVKWIQAFAGHGIHIDAVTPQNEPLNRGNSASLFMGWDEQRDFIKVLGAAIHQAGLDTRIYAFDHNYNYDNMADQNDYPVKIYNDADAAQYLAGAAYHNYGGDKSELLDIHEKAPDKALIFTETSIGTWNNGHDLSQRLMDDMAEVALGSINNWCEAVIVWNLMLDSNRGPNRDGGCQTCYGAVDISSSNYKSITRNSHYYIIAHLSAVIKPGAVRIGTTGYTVQGLTYSAFKNTDGTYAFVVLNNQDTTQSLTLNDGINHFSYEIPAKAVASFRW
ncbi:glycoside hydrolase family 30 protein [Geofilum sp. OHC36d9]|uniref:glycoside hydrolase family 30 protein n=1 Tax=Geofilum sp. OHC36d9 TaxID=3458413 RepID=UPI004034F4DD